MWDKLHSILYKDRYNEEFITWIKNKSVTRRNQSSSGKYCYKPQLFILSKMAETVHYEFNIIKICDNNK